MLKDDVKYINIEKHWAQEIADIVEIVEITLCT